nr:isocitrate lyase/phosphoenolpyruvate mutase family protein [Bradyrhizobium sp. CCBAU 45394]
MGYRDANEASWSQLVDVVERIGDSAELPVLVDGDSGFGNFNNARLLARKLCQRGGRRPRAGGQLFSKNELVRWRATCHS